MVTARSSDIAHRGLAICNPLASTTVDRVVDYARMGADGSALDIGCGKGEFLLRLVARYGCSGVGIDANGARIEVAYKEAAARGVRQRVRFIEGDARVASDLPGPFALTACLGSTHALGGLKDAIAAMSSWTAPGGWLVVGEGFWVRKPDPAYLRAIGSTPDELGRDGWVEQAARVAGLDPVQRWTATREEWDAYEGTLLSNMEAYVKGAPEDPEGPSMLREQRAFHDAQVRWGRDTMGFAVFLLRKPDRSSRGAPGLG